MPPLIPLIWYLPFSKKSLLWAIITEVLVVFMSMSRGIHGAAFEQEGLRPKTLVISISHITCSFDLGKEYEETLVWGLVKPNTNAVDMSCSKASAHAAVISITLVVSNVFVFFRQTDSSSVVLGGDFNLLSQKVHCWLNHLYSCCTGWSGDRYLYVCCLVSAQNAHSLRTVAYSLVMVLSAILKHNLNLLTL